MTSFLQEMQGGRPVFRRYREIARIERRIRRTDPDGRAPGQANMRRPILLIPEPATSAQADDGPADRRTGAMPGMPRRRGFCLGLLALGAAGAPVGRPARSEEEILAVDCHAHVFTRDLPLAGERRYVPAYDATVAHYLGMLDRSGMSHGVLVQPSFLGTDNTYMLEALRREPRRLRGIAVVAPETAPDELGRLDQAGVVGLRLNLIGRPDPVFDSENWRRHLAHVAALGWQVEVHAEARRLPGILR